MAEQAELLATKAVRDMLAAYQIPDVEGDVFQDLVAYMGQSPKLVVVHTYVIEVNGEESLASCPVVYEENIPDPDTTPPQSPKSTLLDGPKVLRKSSREVFKRSYLGMQCRPRKKVKSKGPSGSPSDTASTDTPSTDTASTDIPSINTPAINVLSCDVSSTNISSIDTPAIDLHSINEPSCDISYTDIPYTDSTTTSDIADRTVDEPSSDKSAVENNTETTIDTALHNTTLGRHLILDEHGNSLEDVAKNVLQTEDTSRNPDIAVPGTVDALVDTDPAVFARLMTCAIIYWVVCNWATIRNAVHSENKRLREVKRTRLEGITEERQQMNMAIDERQSLEINYQREEKRLKRDTENAITSLTLRKAADKILQGIVSKPIELTGDFKDASDFDKIIEGIEKDDAESTKDQQRALWKETYYWPAIQQRAKMIGPLPIPPGPKVDMSPQERQTAKRVVIALKYGASRDSIVKARSYLKLLSDLREAGVQILLICRTPEFKTYFLRHPNKLNMLLSWNQLCDPFLQQLRLRVIAEEENDFTGRHEIQDKNIEKRLHLLPPEIAAWRNDLVDWAPNSVEQANYLAHHNIKPTSSKSTAHVLRYGIKGQPDQNKAIFVALVPFEGVSGKKTFSGKPASTELIAVAPLVSVSPGDFLGIFSGRLRYIDEKPARAIRGPVQGLWLDYSQVPGKLNRMRAAKAGEQTNVCLAWEGVNEVKGEKTFCQYWRVVVIATRHIMPFDQLVRPM